jgi:hypothetical protein
MGPGGTVGTGGCLLAAVCVGLLLIYQTHPFGLFALPKMGTADKGIVHLTANNHLTGKAQDIAFSLSSVVVNDGLGVTSNLTGKVTFNSTAIRSGSFVGNVASERGSAITIGNVQLVGSVKSDKSLSGTCWQQIPVQSKGTPVAPKQVQIGTWQANSTA